MLPQIRIIKMDKKDYFTKYGHDNWDYPFEELDYLLDKAIDEDTDLKFALIDNRLYEIPKEV